MPRTRFATWPRPEPAPGEPAPQHSGLPLVVESSAAAQPLVAAADPEAERLIAGCDRQSLAECGRALLDEWLTDEMPASEAWVVLAQAHVGDDSTMDKLAPLVRSWPARSRYARAIDGHPILGPIARRLLWGEFDAGKRLVRALRVAEDGSFADVHDTTAIVDGDAPLGIVHPAELGGDLAGWAQTFADYEILQPFPQLHRPAVVLTEAERAATSLAGFGPVATDRVVGLLRGRWQGNGFHPSSRLHTQLARELPGGLTLLAEVDPGVTTSTHNTVGEQRITEIWVDDAWSDHWQIARRTPMGAGDSAALSEVLVELYALGRDQA